MDVMLEIKAPIISGVNKRLQQNKTIDSGVKLDYSP
jgi:hypothetical protein